MCTCFDCSVNKKGGSGGEARAIKMESYIIDDLLISVLFLWIFLLVGGSVSSFESWEEAAIFNSCQ